MADNNNPPVISGAIEAPPDNTGAPRHPMSLQGLLRVAMNNRQDAGNEPESSNIQADPERMKFLESAVKSMTVDIIQKMQESIHILRHANKLRHDSDLTTYFEAFDCILDHVDRIDTAIDFYKIDGFSIFDPCLSCTHGSIRQQACRVLAECVQNNSFCQDQVVTHGGLLPRLLSIVRGDPDSSVRANAIRAISCCVRDHDGARGVFFQLDGVATIARVFTDGDEKCKERAAFFLSRLNAQTKEIRDPLMKLNIIPTLVRIITQPRTQAHEFILELLWQLIENNPIAIDLCTQPELDVKRIVKRHIQIGQGKEEMYEDLVHCKAILEHLDQVIQEQPETDR